MHRSPLHFAFVLALAAALAACDPAPAPADAGPSDAPRPRDVGTDAGPPAPSRPAPRPLTQWVDPFIGSGGYGFTSIGSTHPGPQTPFGMARPGPDTGNETGEGLPFLHCAGYHADDDYVRAFSMWRLHGFGVNDGGAAPIMPVPAMSAERTTQLGWLARIAAGSQHASPGFYEVSLEPPTGATGGVTHV